MTPALSNTKNYRGVIANEGNYGQFLEETIIPHEGALAQDVPNTQSWCPPIIVEVLLSKQAGMVLWWRKPFPSTKVTDAGLHVTKMFWTDTRNVDESNAEESICGGASNTTTYPCHGADRTSAINHLAINSLARNHDDTAANQGRNDNLQNVATHLHEGTQERVVYRHVSISSNLLDTFQATTSTKQARAQVTNTGNPLQYAQNALLSQPAGIIQCPSKVIQQSLPNTSSPTWHSRGNQRQQQVTEPMITLNHQQINNN